MTRYTFDDDFPIVSEGLRTLRLAAIAHGRSKDGAKNVVTFYFEDIDTGMEIKHWCVNEADPKMGGRWNLKKTFAALLGRSLPKGDIDIKDDDVVGRRVRAEIIHTIGKRGGKFANIKEFVMNEEVAPGQTAIGEELKNTDKLPWETDEVPDL